MPDRITLIVDIASLGYEDCWSYQRDWVQGFFQKSLEPAAALTMLRHIYRVLNTSLPNCLN